MGPGAPPNPAVVQIQGIGEIADHKRRVIYRLGQKHSACVVSTTRQSDRIALFGVGWRGAEASVDRADHLDHLGYPREVMIAKTCHWLECGQVEPPVTQAIVTNVDADDFAQNQRI